MKLITQIFAYLTDFQYIYIILKPMFMIVDILNFRSLFPDENACVSYLKEQRLLKGVVCNQCGYTEHRWDAKKKVFECKKCHSRQSLRSGTVMQYSKLPLLYWFTTICLLTSTKKSFSAIEIQRKLKHKRYQPIWEMVCKLRDALGKRDAEYKLKGQVELDEGFFTIERPEDLKDEPLKRGHGSQNKAKVLVTVQSVETGIKPNRGRPSKAVGHLKMKLIPDLTAETITNSVKELLESNVDLTTDDSTSYINFRECVNSHVAVKSDKETTSKFLPWVHIAISNCKRLLLDIHHKLKNEFLQYYLNEFCYKFNRRDYGDRLFESAIFVAISYQSDFKSRIYGRTTCG